MSGSEGSACNKFLNTTKVKDLKDLWLDSGPATTLAGSAYEEVLFEAQLMQVLHEYNATHTVAPGSAADGDTLTMAQSNPLFIYYAPHLVHSPYQIPSEWLHKFDFIEQVSSFQAYND
jgi:arylsulfatase I/J